jgi:hypothetical protein
MAEAHAAPRRGASVPVEIGASSLLPFLTCLDSARRASDSLSSPQAGGAGRANGARLDGVARAWPSRQTQVNKFPPSAPARTDSEVARCPRNRRREPLQIEQKALTKMSAVARNIDFVSVSEKAPASTFAWVAHRVRIICCYASAIPRPICEALAELFSCRPHRAPVVYSTLRYFPPPKSRIKHPRAGGSSARRSLADASVSHCRTVVRPLQRMRLERDADDNRTAWITPSNARFTDLGMLVSRLTFIQQRSYDRRCRTSHSCQNRKWPLRRSERGVSFRPQVLSRVRALRSDYPGLGSSEGHPSEDHPVIMHGGADALSGGCGACRRFADRRQFGQSRLFGAAVRFEAQHLPSGS